MFVDRRDMTGSCDDLVVPSFRFLEIVETTLDPRPFPTANGGFDPVNSEVGILVVTAEY